MAHAMTEILPVNIEPQWRRSADEQAERAHQTWRAVERFAPGAQALVSPKAWFLVLQALPPSSHLILEFSPRQSGVTARAGFCAPGDPSAHEAFLTLALPGIAFGSGEPGQAVSRAWTPLHSAGLDPEALGTQAVPGPRATASPILPCMVRQAVAHSIDPSRLAVLCATLGQSLRLKIGVAQPDATVLRAAGRMRERVAGIAVGAPLREAQTIALLAYLRALASDEPAFELSAYTSADAHAERDLLSRALFGAPAVIEDGAPQPFAPDLRGVWLAEHGPLALTPDAETIAGLWRHQAAPAPHPEIGGLILGETASGADLVLSPSDRARHVYVIGATGSGKSTLLVNLIEQDVRNGQGVIVLDPHGDLADDAGAAARRSGRTDILLADASDSSGAFRINILEGFGLNSAAQRNHVANGLIRLLRRVLYDGVPEAFGPMFEVYFRNALILLMDGGEEAVTLLDFEAVFADEAFRRRLLDKCSDAKVVQFWREIAEKVTHDEIALHNIAPYVTCKLTQFTGNPVLRDLVCQRERNLDFAGVMDRGEVLILKAPKGLIGQTDTEILGALTLMRIVQAGMARAARPRTERRPVRLYVDEFQSFAGDSLADLLAESRKFGISLVLANQSLRQVDGRGFRPDVGEAALANAANLIALRVGAPDALALAPWFESDPRDFTQAPDFHARARVLQNGRPVAIDHLRLRPA